MIRRIKAVLIQEYYISVRSLEIWMDNIFFPLMTSLVFGLIARYFSGNNSLAGKYLILGMLLWQIIQIAQYSFSIGALWNVWSRNLTNMFITPLSLVEYMGAQIISSIVKALFIFSALAVMYYFFFGFNILNIGLVNLSFYAVNLLLFAWSVSFVLLGAVFKYGTRIQALAWGTVFLFQPLAAVFFPVSILPSGIREVALLIPVTYVFEAARGNLTNTQINWQYIGTAFFLNIIYLIVSILIFRYLFNKSKETGQFVRNEG